MCRILLLLLVIPALVWGQPPVSQPKPVGVDSNGVLTPANVNGVAITVPSGTNLGGGTRAQRGLTKEVWLSVRTDSPSNCVSANICGGGTQEDPYDASTSTKFDAIFQSYYDTSATNVIFHLGGGTMQTKNGGRTWIVLQGWQVIGAGRETTTVKFDPAIGPFMVASGGYAIFQGSYNVDGRNKFTDMTLDCNSQNIVGGPAFTGTAGGIAVTAAKDFATAGISVHGNYTVIERVRVKNACGLWGRVENFSIKVESYVDGVTPQTLHDNVAKDVIIESPQGTYMNGIVFVPWQGNPIYATWNNLIEHCTVNDYYSTNDPQGAAYFADTVVNSTANNCRMAYRTEGSMNVKITGCTFLDIRERAISLEVSATNDFLLKDCYIEVRDDNATRCVGVYTGTLNQNLHIDNVTFIRKAMGGGTPSTLKPIVLNTTTGKGVSITNCRFSSNWTDVDVPLDATMIHNRTLAGAVILGLVDSNIVQATDAYHNFGGVLGDAGYGIRDDSGTIEFKNSGGSWTSLAEPFSTSAALAAIISDPTGFTTGAQLVFNINPIILYPNSAMGALVIDITKRNNTKSISADSTFTLSGTPTSGQSFGIKITTDATARVVTLPAGTWKSESRNGATITTLVIPASSTISLLAEYEGSSTYRLYGEPLGGTTDEVQALSGAGAVNLTTGATAFTSTGGAQALTLADGSPGQIKHIGHVVDGGSGVLTPTTASGWSTATFTNVGDSLTLEFFTGAGWIVLASNGTTVAP